jgi:hypothetical protein
MKTSERVMNYKTVIFGIAFLLMAMLVLPAAACPPTCPPGEVWGQTGQTCYQVPAVYGQCNECPHHHEEVCSDTCDHAYCKNQGQSCSQYDYEHHRNDCKYRRGECLEYDSVKIYDCHSEGYVSCGFEWQHKEKQLITPAHEQCDPVFGCVAVSCPAIPCPEGQDCVDGQCLPRECPRIPCDEGTHCVETQCTPDICGADFQCDEGYQCGEENSCVEIPRKSGHAYFSNPYWDQIGGCPGALNAPTGSLPTTGNGDIVVKAISCIIDERGDKYGCTALDGMKLFYRANDDGVFLPTCAKRCYFGGCDSVTAMGGYPLTAAAKNPQEKLRAVVCKPYGDTYDVFTIQVTFEKPGMETVTMSTKDSCFDQTLSIGAYCGGCRASPSLAAIFHPAWIAPADSPLWDTCRA